MSKLALVLLGAALMVAPHVDAQQEYIPPNCSETENSGSRDCFIYRLEKADEELNRVYPLAIAEAQKDDRLQVEQLRGYEKALREAQRAWISFRDAQCEFESFGARGGSEASILAMICMTEMTKDRTAFLKGDPNKR